MDLLLRLTDAEIAYGDRLLLDGARLGLAAGEKVALVGRNGAGKSTLLKVLAGDVGLDDGERWVQRSVTLSTLEQAVPAETDETVYQCVTGGLGALGALLERYRQLSSTADDAALRALPEVEAAIEAQGGWLVEQRVERMLQQMELPGDRRLAECSGGMQRRAMLARALVAEADLLLLDEPTNHLDMQNIDALQQQLQSTRATVVMVSHDRALIDAVATRIVEVDRGRLTSYAGSYASYRALRDEAQREEAASNRRFDQVLAREERWIRQGIKARRTRNEGRVRRLKALRETRAARQNRQGTARLGLDEGGRSGAMVATLEHVGFGFETPLISDFSARIMRGDRIGILGPNGCGKSTLIRLILGELAPHQGQVTLGEQLQVAYFDQQRSALDERRSIRDAVSEGSETVTVAGKSRHVVGYLGDFLFPASQLGQPVGSLSGGEKNRLLMARLFTRPANLLVMDEPTNDLDVETLELLEELLTDFSGTLLLVSHDRAFVEAVVTSTIVFEGAGQVREYVGGYEDLLRQQRLRSTPAPAAPAGEDASPRRKREGAKRTRLGYLEQRELKALPGRIEQLEAEQAQLQTQVSDPGFYQQEAAAISAGLAKLEETTHTLEAAYERWEALLARESGTGDVT
ncbi:MAG: ATP-binding cassette domain-containing protein [Pseudomonadota bacterium]